MKQLLALAFITLLALGTACAWISPSSQTTSDGIQVHGHWTMTVTNPDGTVDAVHEFNNDLTTQGGARTLATILSGYKMTGSNTRIQGDSDFPSGWRLYITNNAGILCDESTEDAPLLELETTSESGSESVAPSFIAVTTCTISSDQNNIEITGVKTQTRLTSSTNHWSGSMTAMWLVFSHHDFDPVLTVHNNQRLSFNIRFTFE